MGLQHVETHSIAYGIPKIRLLSRLEMLPPNLLGKIIKLIPESVIELRLTSRTLKLAVDKYAKESAATPIVEKLMLKKETPWNDVMTFTMITRKRDSILFWLRMISLNRKDMMRRIQRCKSNHTSVFKWRCQSDDYILNYLRDCLGSSIWKLVIEECCDQTTIGAVVDLLNGKGVGNVEVHSRIISDDTSYCLLRMLENHHADQLSLIVGEVVMSDPVDLLLHLSQLVRSISIKQERVNSINYNSQYFFGLHDEYWAPIILDMFGENLDHLLIHNLAYPRYLSNDCSDILRQRLPFLGKPLSFSATCTSHVFGFNYMQNEYSVWADKNHVRVTHSFMKK